MLIYMILYYKYKVYIYMLKCCKYFIKINMFNPPNNDQTWVLLLPALYYKLGK